VLFLRSHVAVCALIMSTAFQARAAQAPRAERIENIQYATVNGMSLQMDASLPVGCTNQPAVIIVHGGGWVAGDRRTTVAPLFQPLNDAGFAWFSISYRLATSITQFGVAIDDVQSAIRFIKSHAAEYGIDPSRLALIGESAGGQLASMAVLRGGPDVAVKAVVALYAPSDLVSLAKTSGYVPDSIRDQVQGTPWEGLVLAGLSQLSPINNVRGNMPPFLFIHGTSDTLVPYNQSVDMCQRMRSKGGSCEVYRVQGGGHGIRWWESYPKIAVAYKAKMINWLEVQLGAPTPTNLNPRIHDVRSSGF
jgi:acetyl esterase/lipase